MLDLKELVQSLFANRDAEGVHDLKSATRMMEQLPENQVLEALNEIIAALQKLNCNPHVGAKERSRTIAYLDEKTRPLLMHLIDVHFGRLVDFSAPPRQVLLTIVSFLGEMANAYSLCLRAVAQSIRSMDSAQLQLFTLRGVMYCGELTKWCYTRYIPVKTGIWNNLNQFYQFAAQQGFDRLPVQPYAGQALTSAQSEYLQALMLALSMPEKCRVQQIDMLSEWLKRWMDKLVLEDQIQPHQQTFAVHVGTPAMPRRLQRDMVGDGWLYINTQKLVAHMQDVAAQLQSGKDPVQLGLPAESALPVNIVLMQQLALLWSRDVAAPSRRDKRSASAKSMLLIRGPEAIAEHLRQLDTASAQFKPVPGALLSITAANESESGMGVKFMPKRAEHLIAGEAVGLMNENDTRFFAIGIVRRLACSPEGEIFAGIEIMSRNPSAVAVAAPESQQSIHVAYSPDTSTSLKNRFLLVPEARFALGTERRLVIQNRPFLIQLDAVREYVPQAVMCGFTVLSKLEK